MSDRPTNQVPIGDERECDFCRTRGVDTKPARPHAWSDAMQVCDLCMGAVAEITLFGVGTDHQLRELSRTVCFAAHWIARGR